MGQDTSPDEYAPNGEIKATNLSQASSLPQEPAPKTATGLASEHGHSLTRIQPMSKHSGASVATFFNGLFTTILGISTLGASITFSYVLSNNTPPPSTHALTAAEIQLLLAISWLLFLLALAFASLGNTLLTFFRDHWKEDWDGHNGKTSQRAVQWYAVLAAGLLGTLVITAFVVLCLVVTGYSPIVGWIALSFTAVFGLLILVSVLYQCPWSWRDNTPHSATCQRATTA